MLARLATPIALLLLLPAAPSAAASLAPEPAGLARARSAVRDVQMGLAAGGLGPAVRGAAASLGIDPLAPSVPVREAPVGTPSDIAPVVAELLAAIESAGESARRALLAPPSTIERSAAQAASLMDAALTSPRDDSLLPTAERFAAAIPRLVDRATLYGGALALAEGIDAALPALRQYGATLPPTRDLVAGCELVDQAPALCIGGTGANTISGDYALVIDLGGNDTHRGSAGGASVLVNGLAAAVTIDVGGADVYDSRPGGNTTSMGAQGAARTGGVGILVDAAGNDKYSITAQGPIASQVLGQGAAVAGVGILSDGGGDDSYTILNSVPSTATHSQGQGFSIIGGMGIFVEGGMGNDVIADRADPPPTVNAEGKPTTSRTRVECCANGVAGSVAVYADGGGTDRQTVEAISDAAEGAAPDQAVAATHGFSGLGGVAVAIAGPGASDRLTLASSTAPRASQATATGFGGGALGGVVGSFTDLGGDDVTRVEARSNGRQEVTVADGCDCAAPISATSSNTYASGLGSGSLGAVGLAHDAAGDDRYLITSAATAVATLHDERVPAAGDPAPVIKVTAEALIARSNSMAYGAAAGHGSFVDAAGNDRYETRSISDATSTVLTTDPAVQRSPIASSNEAISEVLASAFGDFSGAAPGVAEFRDLGGADTYRVENVAGATTEPPIGGSPGTGMSSAAGSVIQNSFSVFLDQGGSDTFTIVPEDSACEGTRGQGSWLDCGSLVGRGFNT